MDIIRLLYKELCLWKESNSRKPLILRGARQVGKTTLIKQFASEYPFKIALNLEKKEDLRYFEEFDSVQDIVNALFAKHNIKSENRSQTLLFIDEIQESPEAISKLRYFYEEIADLHVIAAGSLLEHVMHDVKSFPVGRVNYLYLQPLNFLEFLAAKEQQGALKEIQKIPIESYAHTLLKDLFHDYCLIGGMPEVVASYLEKDQLSDLASVYESIQVPYRDDVEKYAKNATGARVIRHIMDTAYFYLDKRIKFQNFGNSNYRSREVSEAMHNLNEARIIQLIYPTTEIGVPIIPDIKKSPRLQFLDTGLMNFELGIQADMIALDDLSHAYKGAVIPHMITQELISLNVHSYKTPNFWVRDKTQSSAEVDLVIPYKELLIPVEVKSGVAGKLKSLHQFVDACDHAYAVRMYAGKLAVEQHKTPGTNKAYLLLNLPYYLGTKLPEYIAWFVENHKL